ncbi:MAG TPA: hypothetical protein VK152_13185, partial [Paludibacter sp.]|nr:hypothetical protein [Paludibacter sp.]
MKNKQHRLTFLLGFLLSSIIISAQVRVVDNKGTILQIDSSKWAIGTNGVDIYNKNMNNSGKVGIGTKTPVATLHNTGSTLLGTSNLSDFAADVAIGTAAATVDAFTAFNIPQATAGITLTLPSPTANTAGRMVFVSNTGSVPLTVGTTLVTVGNTIQFIWNGTSWAPSATPLKWYAENLSAPATAPVATGAGSIALGDGAMAETGDMFVYGNSAGAGATGADNSNFIGSSAGNGATDASNSNFMGSFAGNGAINANESNMLGSGSGTNATFAGNSNFLGYNAGANATNASQSNFLGNSAGANATDADNSNFLGFNAGQDAANASFSNLLGYKAGRSFASNNIGSNNIIIGTNISLPDATANAINLGGVLFGTGTNSTVIGDPVVAPVAGGKIGIGTNTPGSTLDVKGTLRLSGSTSGYVGFAPAAAAGSTTYTLPSA